MNRKSRFLIRKKDFFLIVGIFIIYTLTSFGWNSTILATINATIVLVLPIFFMVSHRKNTIAFLIGVIWTYFNYSIVFSRYFIVLTQYQAFYKNCSQEVMGQAIAILSFFTVILYLAFEIYPKRYDYSILLFTNGEDNLVIVIGCLIFVAICAIFGIDTSTAIVTGRANISSLYEYAVLGFIFAFIYSGKQKIVRNIIIIAAVLYSMQGMLCGERIVAVQVVIVVFIFCFSERLRYNHILFLSFLAIILMLFVGIVRNSITDSISIVDAIAQQIQDRYFTFDGMDLAYYCSITFLMIINKFSLTERLSYLGKMLLSIPLGFSNVKGAHLGLVSREYYMHYNGGLFPFFFYFYGGLPCVALFSWILYKILKATAEVFFGEREKYEKRKMRFYTGLFITLTASFPRWYAYNPQIFFRQIFLYSIIFIATYEVNKLMKRTKKPQ